MNETEQIKSEALTITEQARAITIRDNAGYEDASALLMRVKKLRKSVADVFKPMKDAAVKAHKAVLEQEKQADAPLAMAEGSIKSALSTYADAQERIRRAEEMRLQEVARKADEDRRIAEAVAAEKAGDKQAAQAIISAPPAAQVVTLASSTPKVAGVSFSERWQFDIVDANAIPREYLLPDMTSIGQVVRALKGDTRIAGVRAYAVKVVAGRA